MWGPVRVKKSGNNPSSLATFQLTNGVHKFPADSDKQTSEKSISIEKNLGQLSVLWYDNVCNVKYTPLWSG